MKKIFLIFLMVLLISVNVFSLSLFGAQDIAKNYLSENEVIDTITQPTVVCETKEYFVIPVNNPLGEPVVFIPISKETSQVYISKSDSFNIKLIKTGFLYYRLTTQNAPNYLPPQLINKISSLVSSLTSKKAQLEGISGNNKGYSFAAREQLTSTINRLDILIVYLTNLENSSTALLNSQNNFLSNPNCDNTAALLSSFNTSFNDYKDLPEIAKDYVQSTNLLVTKLVSDDNSSTQEINALISLVSASSSLSTQIKDIYDTFYSANSFYSKHSSLLGGGSGSNGDKTIKIYVDNLSLRVESVKLKNLLKNYDSSFPSYANLDSVIKIILDDQYKGLWKEQAEVENLFKTYNEINELSKNARYTDASLKVPVLKKSALKIIDAGLSQEVENEFNSSFYYVFVGVILLLLIIFFVITKRKNKNKPFKKSKSKKQGQDLFDYNDPF